MGDWYVDRGLAVLIRQIRDRQKGVIVIGTIAGNQHHKDNPTSDHEPEADDSVDAADFMIGPNFTKDDANWLANTLAFHRDERLAYIIWNGSIVSSTVSPWEWRQYNGKDDHSGHVHVSVNDKHENDTRLWKLGLMVRQYEPLDGLSLPVLTYGMNDRDYEGYWNVTRLQQLIGVKPDGIYGKETAYAVKDKVGTGDGRKVTVKEWTIIAGLSRR